MDTDYYHLNSASISEACMNLRDELRMLWEEHVTWTRLAVLSLVFNLPDVSFVLNRLLRNPKDFEAVLMPLYGREKAAGFADLLKTHLVIAAQLVKAAKAGDSYSVRSLERQWYQNADEIAAFLAGINPFWNEAGWREMFHRHLALTEQEAVTMLQKEYQKSIETYDEIEKQALGMADYMASGIVQQFPRAFTG